MLKHGRAGVPMEVMGLMLGEFVDEYTVQVIDVFAMPQSGTTVSVESVDHVFQTKMMEMLKQTGRYVALPPLYSHISPSAPIPPTFLSLFVFTFIPIWPEHPFSSRPSMPTHFSPKQVY